MEFNTNELLQVRDCIDNILNNSIKDWFNSERR
jgi:hypothetical protein